MRLPNLSTPVVRNINSIYSSNGIHPSDDIHLSADQLAEAKKSVLCSMCKATCNNISIPGYSKQMCILTCSKNPYCT